MMAKDKRFLAEECLLLSLDGKMKEASRIRQEAYEKSPPGSIGVDWSDWDSVWRSDARYISFLNDEDFSDADNSAGKVQAIRAGIFVDYLFGFRDFWGVLRQSDIVKEKFKSKSVEDFLLSINWAFESENREIIYSRTKMHNISARMYYDSIHGSGLRDLAHPYIFRVGQYHIGFLPGTPQTVMDGRRKWIEDYEMFVRLGKIGIDGFPKTFKTFQKHKLNNSEKYLYWSSFDKK